MKRSKMTAAVLVLIALIVFGASYPSMRGPNLELSDFTYFNPKDMVQGMYRVEPTFENIMTKMATHVIIGVVKTVPDEETPGDMYDIAVTESLIGQLKEDVIKVYGAYNVLQTGKSYVLVLNEFVSTVYPFDFYVMFREFVLEIEDDDGVKRLANPVAGTYVKPFKDEKYNSLTELKKQIRAVAHRNINKDKAYTVIEEAKSLETLVDLADHILHIELTDLHTASTNLVVSARFGVIKAYKGGDLKNVYSLVLPAGVKVKGQYLVFLRNHKESVTLATRVGSIIPQDHEMFGSIVEMLMQK